ncbi:MAG: helix-turn-helix transcriptional regulator [Oleiphilaceae bacterium]|nr:helix-turn-helix transcriptional regulator [Oleiphilaceae bacterium]
MAQKKDSKQQAVESMLLDIMHAATSMSQVEGRVGRALSKSQGHLKLLIGAGHSLRDIRQVAGLTLAEMSEALNVKDKSLLQAVEDGTSTLSFELILRLAALVARNDPVPFILKYIRAYNPEAWQMLDDWGVGKIPLQFEREREFVNIFRSHDDARELSDAGFEKVLSFTRQSFEMALHFVAEQELAEPESAEGSMHSGHSNSPPESKKKSN